MDRTPGSRAARRAAALLAAVLVAGSLATAGASAAADDPVAPAPAQQRDFVSFGLLAYPVLQAADILAYQTDEVPVGEDQKQHLELTRDIAQRFNARYGETFVIPTHRIPAVAARVMDLQVPTSKMSTTGGTDLGTVSILDDAETIRRKFKSAVTDSGREIVGGPGKEGIANLIEILAACRGVGPEEIEKEYADASGYAAFKQDVGEAGIEQLAPVGARYERLRSDGDALEATLAGGADKARSIASETVAIVRDRMGIGPRP